MDPRYEMTSDVRGQIKFLEELDKAEQKRHEEVEREILIRAAKSRSKTEDPEQAKLKAKVNAHAHFLSQPLKLFLLIGKGNVSSGTRRTEASRSKQYCTSGNWY
jgi:hypothetical protein